LIPARIWMMKASAAINRSGSAYGLGWVSILTACIDIEQARPDLADTLLSEARVRVVSQIGEDADVVHTLDFVHARALLDLGRQNEVRKLVLNGLKRAHKHGLILTLEHGLAATAALWKDAPLVDALALESQLEKVASSYPARAQVVLAARKIRRLVHEGKLSDATNVADQLRNHASLFTGGDHAKLYERGEWLLAQCDLMVVSGDCQKALKTINEALKNAVAQERYRDAVELHLLAMDAHHRLDQMSLARRSLAMAIVRATSGHLIHPFRTKSWIIHELLSKNTVNDLGLVKSSERALLQRVSLDAQIEVDSKSSSQKTVEAESPSLAKTLSAREIHLLALLDEGLNNDQVADRLALSVATVKWHLHRAYAKLGVRSRSAAIARARAMNLLVRTGK
jgi:LuxR family transcriptional regulator, maltose regulon positive regulatory protein